MLYSPGQAAAKIGRSKSSVLRAAKRLRLGVPVGVGGTLGLTAQEIERIAAEIQPIGSYNFKPGNYFGRPRKKSRNPRKQSK